MDSILHAPSPDDLANRFLVEARRFGIGAFAISRKLTRNGFDGLPVIRWPDWIEFYAINGFVNHDVAITEINSSQEPFTWTELKRRHPGADSRVFDAASRFGWNDGFIVPVGRPDDRQGFISLASASSCLSWDSAKRAEIVSLSLTVYSRSRELTAGWPKGRAYLSAREQEALSLVANGQSDVEIAKLMSISTTTAHAHVERAKRRLGATTRAQAVALAVRARLI